MPHNPATRNEVRILTPRTAPPSEEGSLEAMYGIDSHPAIKPRIPAAIERRLRMV
jgi:hypothetical protein